MASLTSTFLKPLRNVVSNYYATQTESLIKFIMKGSSLSLIDVGAAGDIEPRWRQVSRLLNYYGFEPDLRSYNDLKNKNNCPQFTVFNKAIWNNNQKIKIHLCKKPTTSSVFEPDASLLELYPEADRFNIVSTADVDASPLDSFLIENADFLKLDIQGGELATLQGAPQILSELLGVEVEVEFIQIYKNQPLFGDICTFLKQHQLEFIDFVHIAKWERTQFSGFGQSIHGDALFLKSPESIVELFAKSKLPESKLRSYLAVLGLYKRVDLIVRTVELIKQKASANTNLQSDTEIYLKKILKNNRGLILFHKIIKRLPLLLGNNIQTVIYY